MVESKCKLPTLKKFSISPLTKDSWTILNFLEQWVLESMSYFHLNVIHPKLYTWLDFYRSGMEVALRGVTKEVHLDHFKISHKTLQVIVRGASRAESLVFHGWIIDSFADLDFSVSGDVETNYIAFLAVGNAKQSNWGSSPYKFDNIIKGLSKSGHKNSLKTININESGDFTVKKAIEILQDNDMGNVEVIQLSRNQRSRQIDYKI